MSTPAIHDGLLFIADWGRLLRCLDAQTGESCWTQEINGEAWASPLVADGKVYFGTRSGEFWIFRASKPRSVKPGAPIAPVSGFAYPGRSCRFAPPGSRP